MNYITTTSTITSTTTAIVPKKIIYTSLYLVFIHSSQSASYELRISCHLVSSTGPIRWKPAKLISSSHQSISSVGVAVRALHPEKTQTTLTTVANGRPIVLCRYVYQSKPFLNSRTNCATRVTYRLIYVRPTVEPFRFFHDNISKPAATDKQVPDSLKSPFQVAYISTQVPIWIARLLKASFD